MFIMLCLYLFGCQQTPKEPEDKIKERARIWTLLEVEFEKETDPIYMKSIAFLEKEMPRQWSNRITLTNPVGATSNFHEKLINGQEQLDHMLAQGWRFSQDSVRDLDLLTRLELSKRIRDAVATRGKYRWNDNLPDSIFLKYLLPYKVINEYPEDWRAHYAPMLTHTLDTLNQALTYDHWDIKGYSLVNQAGMKITESDHFAGFWSYKGDARSFNTYPSLSELYCFRQGTCYYGANLFVYIMRSSGIPSTVDEIPIWGNQNGRHAYEVVYNQDKHVFEPGERHGIKLVGPAKVLRRTFHRVGKYSDEILPLIKNNPFPLPFLKHDYWYDSTEDSNDTKDISLSIPQKFADLGYALIYVLNYNNWTPLYYGKVNGDKVIFPNMGTGVIYRAGNVINGQHQFFTTPFMLQENGSLRFPRIDESNTTSITVEKINHGALSQVEAGENYTLLVMKENGQWQKIETKTCQTKGKLTFPKVPSDVFYLLSSPSDQRNLARIFLIDEDGTQVFY